MRSAGVCHSGRRPLAALLLLLLLACTTTYTSTVSAAATRGGARPPAGYEHQPEIIRKDGSSSYRKVKVATPTSAASSSRGTDDNVAAAGDAPVPVPKGEGHPARQFSFFPGQLVAGHRQIPHWSVNGHAQVDNGLVRLTPQKQSKSGAVWTVTDVELTDWEAVIEFKVTGKKELGGDGFAFWYVERSEVSGTVFGSTDYWNGLAVIFDTYNNDAEGPTPFIAAIFNDGTQRFDHTSDGASQALASCSFDIRNQPTSSLARIRYIGGTLSVEIALTHEQDGRADYKKCFVVPHIELGIDKYFGLTAHTGAVADAHEIMRFEVTDYTPKDVDLDEIRSRYYDDVHEQQHEHEHGRNMTMDDFQHQVMTLLNQIQDGITGLETTQMEISDYINEEREAKLDEEEDEEGRKKKKKSKSSSSSSVDMEDILGELRSLKQKVSSGSGSGSAALSSDSLRSLNQHLKPSFDSHTSALNDLRREVRDYFDKQQRKMDDLMSAMDRLVQSGHRQGMSGGSASAELSWTVWTAIILTAIFTVVLTIHTFKVHREKQNRYKFM